MAKSKWPGVLEKIENGLVEAWARDGLIDAQMAAKLGISLTTYYSYQKVHTEFSDALKRGKEVVDREVESALHKLAVGFIYDEVTKELDDSGQLVVTKIVTKQQAPNVTADIFWLKNRMPKAYRDKPVVDDDDAMADDGFIDALDGKMGSVWDDE